jgi:hypothetical protein
MKWQEESRNAGEVDSVAKLKGFRNADPRFLPVGVMRNVRSFATARGVEGSRRGVGSRESGVGSRESGVGSQESGGERQLFGSYS